MLADKTVFGSECKLSHFLPAEHLRLESHMAKTYLQVQKQIDELTKEADLLRKKEAKGVLERIKEAIAIYGFTAEELGVSNKTVGAKSVKPAAGKRSAKVKTKTANTAAKFKDDQGNVWSGRGPRPAWFKAALEAGKQPDELLA